jgi:hypothetical protein
MHTWTVVRFLHILGIDLGRALIAPAGPAVLVGPEREKGQGRDR